MVIEDPGLAPGFFFGRAAESAAKARRNARRGLAASAALEPPEQDSSDRDEHCQREHGRKQRRPVVEHAEVREQASDQEGDYSVIVDLAAQTAAPLASWIGDSDLLSVLDDMGVTVNFWHLADTGKDSVDLLERLVATYGRGPNYIVVKNLGRGRDFSLLDESPALASARALGARVMALPALDEASMRKIDRRNASFWAAINTRPEVDALGMLERQRVKTWLKGTYSELERLPL